MPTIINVQCSECNKTFGKELKEYTKNKQKKLNFFCSKECSRKFHIKPIEYTCSQCNKTFIRNVAMDSRCKHSFCNSSCAATYNNTHKTKGYRRSKLEFYIEKRIKEVYGEDFALFNNKDIINSELDIYVPSLKLAIELNGIFHYEPIYGEHRLKQIQNNDHRKIQACIERSIGFCTIDTSTIKKFKEHKAEEFFKIIQSIIEENRKHIESNDVAF
jgi:hypothetical protein